MVLCLVKIKPWRSNFYSKSLDSKKSTTELTFYEMYFVDTAHFPHTNEEIILYSVDRKKSRSYYTDDNGKIEVMLPCGMWGVNAKKLGIKKKLDFHSMPCVKRTKDKIKDYRHIYLYNWDEKIKLNILFETNKSSIKSESYPQLDNVVSYLNRKKEEKIEIIGHTDNVGNSKSNLALSKQRAEAIKKYLVSKGVSSDRIQTLGKGGSEPIADNNSEKGRAKNRRTEIRVIN